MEMIVAGKNCSEETLFCTDVTEIRTNQGCVSTVRVWMWIR